jgi:anion-transporting  ArsA/GET3 family ATPase
MSESAEVIPPDAMLGESDWDDEDLLTVVEASERLVDEIKASRERIRQAQEVLANDSSAGNVDEVAVVQAERKRLEELMRAVERIKAAQANAPR